MPGEKPGGNPEDKSIKDQFDLNGEPTPEEKAREEELAEKRMEILAQRAAEIKAVKSKPARNKPEVSVDDEVVSPFEDLKLGKVKENRSGLRFGTSSTRRAAEAKRLGVSTGRSEEGQETDHNRDIKDILKKFIFAGSFKLRTSQEKGKFILRLLSGVEGHKDTRVELKVEGTMEDIKAKLEKHLVHNFTRK